MKSFKNYLKEDEDLEYQTNEASVTIIHAQDTERFLFVKRSSNENEPETWSITIGGGKDEEDNDSSQTVNREVREEIGELSNIISQELIDIYIDSDKSSYKGFKYNTYYTIVDKEFVPTLNWEHSSHKWVDINNDILPEPLHFGTDMLMNMIKRRLLGGN